METIKKECTIILLPDNSSRNLRNYHFHIYSNDKIEKNDWFYSQQSNTIERATNFESSTIVGFRPEKCNKIIATTALLETEVVKLVGMKDSYSFKFLPRIPHKVIEVFINTGINEVLVTYTIFPEKPLMEKCFNVIDAKINFLNAKDVSIAINRNQFLFHKTCTITNKEYKVSMTKAQYFEWKEGKHIQYVCPNLSPDQREFLISGITPAEWDSIFANIEE